jgi:valyl-tRNA synthetase
MSKSKGNVVTPMDLLVEHGSDAVRYWAASAKLGTDAAFEVGQMKIGRRLAIKVLNASKFALSFGEVALDPAPVTNPLDRAMLAGLADVVDGATSALEAYDHTRALELTESFFWTFCDDYLELVKERAYAGDASAVAALRTALDVLLRLLAPVISFATEDVWSWTHEGSIHRAAWPDPVADGLGDAQPRGLLPAVSAALVGIRRAKTDAKASQKTDVRRATVAGPAILAEAADDLRAVGRITELSFTETAEVAVTAIELDEALA